MLVSGSLQTKYLTMQSDLRVNIPSGVLVLGDGSSGGGPLDSINYGIPAGGIGMMEARPSGIQGDSLQAMMNQFPTYSRISWDPSSVGAQLLNAASAQADELLEERDRFFFQQFAPYYPTNEQGVVYEYDFSSYNNLADAPQAQARLGTSWFQVPVTRDENWFWQAPPTRLETTTAEVSGWNLLAYTQVGGTGLVDLGVAATMPVNNWLYVTISGASQFSTVFVDEDPELAFFGYVEIHGYWANDTQRHQRERVERINIGGNTTVASVGRWREITAIKVNGMDEDAYVRVDAMNFNAPNRPDSTARHFVAQRGEFPEYITWQVGGPDTDFSSLIQTEEAKTYSSSDPAWLFKCRQATDRITDEDVEFHVTDWWKVMDHNGTELTGVIDMVQVPWTHYLLLLTDQSEVYVVDTWKPALNMTGFLETKESPARIEMEYPLNSSETPTNFTVNLNALTIKDVEAVTSYRWAVHHNGIKYAINESGNFVSWGSEVGWQNPNSLVNVLDSAQVTISGTGQYTFELESVTAEGNRYRTYSALQVVEKQAVGMMPVRGLSAAPSGIDIDMHGRPWVTDGATAVRLVLRTDIGIWDENEHVFLSREPYDEVRQL